MPGYGFSLTWLFPYKDRIVDSVLVREYAGQRKTVICYILHSISMSLSQISKKKLIYWTISLLNHASSWYQLCFTWQSTNICSITLTLLLMFLF